MAKEIGIKINFQSTGQEVVVKNLNELEVELQKLQTDLKNLEFGSEAFNTTAANIQTLKSKIEDVDKATEGLGVEKRFQAIGAAVGVAVGSFQALSGVVGLFTSDAEDLKKVQEAEAKALQVLNIALGVNSVALQLNEAWKLKDIVATKAQAVATKAAAAAQRLWNLALAANPIGLFLTGLAALTAAIIYYNSETKKSVEVLDEAKIKQDELNKISEDSVKIKGDELKKIVPLLALTEKENLSRENRTKAIKAIQKEYPDYLKNADLEKLTLQDIKKANEDLVKSIEKVAKSRAALNELTEIYTKELEIEANLEKAKQSRDEALAKIAQIGTAREIEGQRKLNEGLELIAKNNAETERKKLAIRKQVALSFIDETSAVKQLTNGLKEEGKEVKKNTDLYLENVRKRIDILNKQIKAVKDARAAELKYTADILQKQQEVIASQEQFLEDRADALQTQSERVVKGIDDLLFKTIPSNEDVKKLSDGYREFFDIIDTAFRSGELNINKPGVLGLDSLLEFAETKLPGIGKRIENVGEENIQSLIEYFGSLKTEIQSLTDFQKRALEETNNLNSLAPSGLWAQFVGFVNPKDIDEFRKLEDAIVDIERARIKTGKTEKQVRDESIEEIQKTITAIGYEENIYQSINIIKREQFFLQANLNKGTEEEQKLRAEKLQQLEEEKNNLIALSEEIYTTITANNEFITGLRAVGNEADKNGEKIKELKKQIDAPLSPEALDGVKEYFKGQAENFDIILTDVFNRSQAYFNKLGKEGINALFQGLTEGLPEVEGQTRQELEKLSAYLTIVGDELADALGLEENPFTKYIEDATKQIKKLPTAFQEAAEDLAKVADVIIRVFQDISSRVQTILQQQTALLLEQLQYQEEAALATIGEANTESAAENEKINKEREKVQKESAKRRFELEKQARVQELQFGLANAIAASAQAVIQALGLPAPPPAPQLYAAAIGGLSAVQILQIREQLQFAQSKTYIGRKGGLVEGSSHEYGGVPALLEGGEFIVSKSAVSQYGDIISGLNASVGAKPLAIDDSRLVQAIASQNTTKTPIKTYVLYNDIQNTDKLNKKIENLSKL